MLTDTGPLIALINRRDPNYVRCDGCTDDLAAEALLTTWPCFTEAMHLLYRIGGHSGQAELWRWYAAGRLILHASSDSEVERMSALMGQYHDVPMDLADASLIAAAERLGVRRIFTLDSDFYIYRLANGSALECVP